MINISFGGQRRLERETLPHKDFATTRSVESSPCKMSNEPSKRGDSLGDDLMDTTPVTNLGDFTVRQSGASHRQGYVENDPVSIRRRA